MFYSTNLDVYIQVIEIHAIIDNDIYTLLVNAIHMKIISRENTKRYNQKNYLIDYGSFFGKMPYPDALKSPTLFPEAVNSSP